MKLPIKYLDNYKFEKMSYAHTDDSGFDCRACDIDVIMPKEHKLIKLGFSCAVPVGHEMQIRPRSGLALKQGITILNTPGTVDAGYRNEIGAIVLNTSDKPFHVHAGDRICQAVICPVQLVDFEEVDELPPSERDLGGFGSTGVK